ncbi:MAG: hypothetical protein IT376_03245 [Polyangiaceae bacterium]|nr:hypothetical protein [Polyangiaceae bacterium]
MSEPVVLKVVRPYASEAELVDAEGWTLGQKGVLLIGTEPLDPGSLVRFELALATGAKLIVAEGRVARQVPATSERPATLDVRFRRYGASTKAFLDRVAASGGRDEPSALESAPRHEAPSGPGVASASAPGSDAPPADEPSGVHLRRVAPIVAPSNRDQLLARLRSRPKSG